MKSKLSPIFAVLGAALLLSSEALSQATPPPLPSTAQPRDTSLPKLPVVTGSSNNFNLDFTPDATIAEGTTIRFKSNQNITGAVTITPDGGTARALVYPTGRAMVSGAISSGMEVIAMYDATNTRWQLLTGSNIANVSDGTSGFSVNIAGSGLTADRTVNIGNISGSLVSTASTTSMSNKTMDNSNIYTIRDDRLTLQDNADTTKQAVLQLSGITTGTTRTYTLPNVTGTLLTALSQDAAPTLGGNLTTTNYTIGSASDLTINAATQLNLSGGDSFSLGGGTDTGSNISDGTSLTLDAPEITITGFELPLLQVALSDETTAITTGTAKLTARMPCGAVISKVRAGLTTTSSSGNPTFDINENGSSILSTKLSIDAGELTSVTAATPPVISDTFIADDANVTFDIDTAGTGAAGAKVTVYGWCI